MTDQPKGLTLTRIIDAPLERVWWAWTDPNEIQKWWGPKGVTNPTCQWEPRPGGQINIVMLAGPELGDMQGQQWPMRGEFKEVVPKQQLVFSAQALRGGQPILETMDTVSFSEENGKTKLTLEVKVTKTTPEAEGPLQGMSMGWNQSLDKLVEHAEGRN